MTDDLVAFLKARLDEDDRDIAEAEWPRGFSSNSYKRAHREVEAKRRIIDWLDALDDRIAEANWWNAPDTDDARKLLAYAYADHPDYRADWRV